MIKIDEKVNLFKILPIKNTNLLISKRKHLEKIHSNYIINNNKGIDI